MSRRPLAHRISRVELEDVLVLPHPAARPRRLILDVTEDLLPQRPQRRPRGRQARSCR